MIETPHNVNVATKASLTSTRHFSSSKGRLRITSRSKVSLLLLLLLICYFVCSKQWYQLYQCEIALFSNAFPVALPHLSTTATIRSGGVREKKIVCTQTNGTNTATSISSTTTSSMQRLSLEEIKRQILHPLMTRIQSMDDNDDANPHFIMDSIHHRDDDVNVVLFGVNHHDSDRIASAVNALEARYHPPHTRAFFQWAQDGNWTLVFSTQPTSKLRSSGHIQSHDRSVPFTQQTVQQQHQQQHQYQQLRVQHVFQIQADNYLTNRVNWDWSNHNNGTFDCFGSVSITCTSSMDPRGSARQFIRSPIPDHAVELSRGSAIPVDVPMLVSRLSRRLPPSLWDPCDHAIDTTYLDETLRIVRYSGPRLEGVRDVFVRVTAIPIATTALNSSTLSSVP